MRLQTPHAQSGFFARRRDDVRRTVANSSVLLLLVFGLSGAAAGATDAPTEGLPADSLVGQWHPAAFPVLAYATETRLVGGGWLQALRTAAPERRESQFACWSTFTQNHQAEVGLRPELWVDADRWLLEGELSYSKWPDSFYGVGPRSREVDEREFTAEGLKLVALASRRLPLRQLGQLHAGLLLDWRAESFQALEAGFPLPADDGENRGLGLELRLDSRDDTIWPRHGVRHRLLIATHGGLLGGDWRYNRWLLDLRGYRPLADGVLAAQLAVEARGGAPGFRQLPRLSEDLRAYTGNRYIDRALAATRVEWRRPLFGRAGLVLFGGAGAVGPALDRLAKSPLRPSVGVGGRWEMIPGSGLNLRVDAAFGSGSSAVTIRLGEEF